MLKLIFNKCKNLFLKRTEETYCIIHLYDGTEYKIAEDKLYKCVWQEYKVSLGFIEIPRCQIKYISMITEVNHA